MPDAPRPAPPLAAAAPSIPVVELLTSPGCHLCEAARADLDAVTGPLGLGWRELGALEHPELYRRHAEEVPVVLVNGVPRDFWRVDRTRLAQVLTGLLQGQDPEA